MGLGMRMGKGMGVRIMGMSSLSLQRNPGRGGKGREGGISLRASSSSQSSLHAHGEVGEREGAWAAALLRASGTMAGGFAGAGDAHLFCPGPRGHGGMGGCAD